MDHRIDTRHAFPLTPLFPGLILTYALYLDLGFPYKKISGTSNLKLNVTLV